MHAGTIAEIVTLILEIKDTEKKLETLESQLDSIKNMPTPAESFVLAHAFVTNILPHLPSRILRDHVLVSNLMRQFGLTEEMVVEWPSDDDPDNVMQCTS